MLVHFIDDMCPIRFATLILSILFVVDAECPVGAIQGLRPGDCYTFSRQILNWYAAEEACIRQGGHLASAGNAFVDYYINDLFGSWLGIRSLGSRWLGGIADVTTSSKWTWTDGTSFAYTHWEKGCRIYANFR